MISRLLIWSMKRRVVAPIVAPIIQEAAASDLPGLIFTFVWALDLDSDRQFIHELTGIVENEAGKELLCGA